MRRWIARWAGSMPGAAVLSLAMVWMLWPGVGAAQAAPDQKKPAADAKAAGAQAGAAAVIQPPVPAKKKAPAKPAAPQPLLGALPNGHVGQEYEARIRGVNGVDVGDFDCNPGPAGLGLPKGLVLDCTGMRIHGHPLETVTGDAANPNVNFAVTDHEGHSVPVQLTLTVLDGPDVVVVAAAKPKQSAAKQKQNAVANPTAPTQMSPAAPAQPPSPADKKKGMKGAAAAAPAAVGASEEEQAGEQAGEEPIQEPSMASEPDDAPTAEPAVAAPAPVAGPAPASPARVVPAVSVVSRGSLRAGVSAAASAAVSGAAGGAGQKPHPEGPHPEARPHGAGVGIEVRKETPVVEGASVINGRITNDSERISGLCVGLKRHDTTVTSAGTGDSYAAVTPPSGSKCPAFYVPVAPDTNEFTLTLKENLRAGVKYAFDVYSMTTGETIKVREPFVYAISLQLPVPKVEVTSLIRDGVSTIAGTCRDLPNPALATNSSATPAVTGNLPRVVVELHEPEAPSGPKKKGPGEMDGQEMEWHTADLLVSTTSQATAQSVEALASADGCTFSVMLKTPLAAGEQVRVKLKAPAGRYFGEAQCAEVIWPGDGDSCTKSIAERVKETWPKGGNPRAKRTDSNPGRTVYTALSVAPPVITSQVKEGISILTGTATPSPTNGAVTIAAISDDDYSDKRVSSAPTRQPSKELPACYPPEEMRRYSGRFLPLMAGTAAATSTAGAFTVTLATPLQDGQRFHLVEVLPARSQLTQAERESCKTTVTEVKGDLDWGRIHADFVAGVLISNDSSNSTAGASGAGSGNFSQAHQFFALNVEKDWALPGCYLRVFAHGEDDEDGAGDSTNDKRDATQEYKGDWPRKFWGERPRHGKVEAPPPGTDQKQLEEKPVKRIGDQCYDWSKRELFPAKKKQHLYPGFDTYFQTRLTAIPVSNVSMDGSVSSTGGGVISTAQTARVEVGAYFPFLITRWVYDHKPNALFVAPLVKTGFDTVTGPSTVNTISTTGVPQSQTFEQVYTYWSYGARIGHMELTRTQNKAPETFSYLDIAIGPYSSLESFICHSNFDTTQKAPAGSECSQYTHLTNAIDSRKRLYRFDIEGLLKIPKTILYVGLNANIGQKTLGASQLDHGFAAPDDIRFLFGTKFDIASVLTKFKLGPQ